MFSTKDLRELAQYRSSDGNVLTLYLDTDPTQHTTDEYKLALRQLLKGVEDEADGADVEAVERFIDYEYDWKGRGIALFSCADEDYWRQYTLAVPVESRAIVSDKPYVTPLAGLWDTYGRFVVAMVDRQGARLLLYQMGELGNEEGMMGEEVRRLKKGRGSAATGRRGGVPGGSARREGEVAARNLKEAAELTVAFCEAHRPRNLLLAGTDETLAQFRNNLPRVWADRVIGSFPADMGEGAHEVRDRAFAILERVEAERETALADAVITAAAKGSNGVVRLGDTLSAVHEGRVQTLVVAHGYRAPGYRCLGCGYITDQPLKECPFCGNEIEEISNAVEAAVAQVLELGARVEIVHDHEAFSKVGIGALLRY
jgi:peptide chain release factor subunit 1